MATAKFTIKRGQVDLKDVAVTAGAAEAQSDTVSINIDYTNASRGEILTMIDEIKQKIHSGLWPAI